VTSKRIAFLTLLTAGALLAACRYTPTHVPLVGAPADIAKMAGTWEGDYSSDASGRAGVIVFEITAGVDTAHGEVLMTPQYGPPLRAADAGTRMHAEHVRSAELLTVRFVRIDGGLIRGELEPYIAPDCMCPVTTVFRGTMAGDRIEGTYVTRGPQGLMQEGRWAVKRKT
jgi:hypothetical protein